jgi:membrane fusion protein, multidrug efflux system
MSDDIFRMASSKRVPLIAVSILALIVAALALQKYFPLGALLGPKSPPETSSSAAPEGKSAGGASSGVLKPGAGAAPANAGNAPPPTPVKATPVKQAKIDESVNAVGSLLAVESVIIRPEIAGRVTKFHFDEGHVVAAGVPLVSIDPAELRAQLAQSTADVTLNKQRYDRSQDLNRQNFISRQALDEASSNLERASAAKQEVLAKLSKTEIRAPFKGVLGLRKISAGAYVKPGDDIVQLDDIGSLKMDFRVPERCICRN